MPLLIYIPSYEGQEAFVLDTDSAVLEWLSENFGRLARSEPEQRAGFTIEGGSLIRSPQCISIHVTVTPFPGPSHITREGTKSTWFLSRDTAERFRELVCGLRGSKVPAHQYLEIDDPNAPMLVLSRGEYDSETLTAMSGE